MVSSTNSNLTPPPRPILTSPDYSKDVAGYDARSLKISTQMFSTINHLRGKYARDVINNPAAAKAIVEVEIPYYERVLELLTEGPAGYPPMESFFQGCG
jgi:hypothetical protein